MTDWCIDLVSPHSHGASLVYTVVSLPTHPSILVHMYLTVVQHGIDYICSFSAGYWASYLAISSVPRMAFHAIHPQITKSAVPHHDDILCIPLDRWTAEPVAVLCSYRGSPVLQPIHPKCALDDDTLW